MKEKYCWMFQVEGPHGPQQVALATDEQDWGDAVVKARSLGLKIIAGPMPQGRVWV